MEKSSLSSDLFMILKNKKVQKLLLAMKSGKFNVIEPVIKFNGGIDYPKLEEFLDSRESAEEALSLLSGIGLLVWDIVDNIVVCPHCGSHKLLLKTRCPSCGSSKIVRGAMIEHMECGHIDFEENFRGTSGLVCPRCKKSLGSVGVDYRTYTSLYRCMVCGSVFQSPKIKYLCDNNHEFDEREFTIRDIKAYRLNPEKKELLEQVTINIEEILQPLVEAGWRVESPAMVSGMTGSKHDFTFASWNKNAGESAGPPDLVGSIHMSDTEANATDVLAFWAKAVDVGAKNRVLMTIPKTSEEGKALAKAYDIKVVEGRDAAKLQDKARKMLRQIIKESEREAAEGEKEETAETTEVSQSPPEKG